MRARLFLSNGRSYTGRHTCSENLKGASLLHVSTTVWSGSFVSFCSQDQHSTSGPTVGCISLTMVGCKVLSMIALESNNSFLPFLSSGFTQEPYPWGYHTFVACTVPQPHKHCLFVYLFFWSAYIVFSKKGTVYRQWTTRYLLLTALLQISMKTQQPTLASGFELTDAISSINKATTLRLASQKPNALQRYKEM